MHFALREVSHVSFPYLIMEFFGSFVEGYIASVHYTCIPKREMSIELSLEEVSHDFLPF
jgi:hypothetical protein